MIVTEIVPVKGYHGKTKYKVRLDSGTDFVLYKREISRFDIEEGTEFTRESFENLIKEIFIPRARARAIHLLEKQDRTRKSVFDKLVSGGYPMEAVENAIEYLVDLGYVDDVRYASNYIRYHRAHKSKRRIMTDLRNKGISQDDMEKALGELSLELEDSPDACGENLFDESLQIENYILKRLSKASAVDWKLKRKIYNHLLYAGFNSSDIASALRRILGDEY